MFEFLEDIHNYDSRRVGRLDHDFGFVSTARVSDGRLPFETAIEDERYDMCGMVIVEGYATKAEALVGHAKWTILMSNHPLPSALTEIGNARLFDLADAYGCGDDLRETCKLKAAK